MQVDTKMDGKEGNPNKMGNVERISYISWSHGLFQPRHY